MARQAYAAIGLGMLASVLLAAEAFVVWAQVGAVFGIDPLRLVPAMGAPLLCCVATLVAARSYALRSVAAGAVLSVGLLTTWGAAWRLTFPEPGYWWIPLIGGLLALGAGIALMSVQTAAPRDFAASASG